MSTRVTPTLLSAWTAVLAILLVVPVAALSQTNVGAASVSPAIATREFSRSLDAESVQELRVKVLGGYVSVKRSWDGAKWTFFPALGPLSIEGSSTAPTSIKRGTARYALLPGTSPRRYASDGGPAITQNASGFRWEGDDGAWLQYDAGGATTAYGDRNQVQVTLLRDGQGRLRGFADHSGRQVITIEYDTAGHLTRASDYSGRQISYGYLGEKLSTVTDVRGNVWREEIGSNRVVTDPEGRVVTHYYSSSGELSAIKDSEGFGVEYQYEFDDATKKVYLQEKHSGNYVIESWFDAAAGVVRRDINGHTHLRVRTGANSRVTTDENGAETALDLDEHGRVIAVHQPDGGLVRIELSTLFGLTSQVTDPRGIRTKYERDSRGNLVRLTEAVGAPDQRVTTFTYDEHGQMLTRTEVVDGGVGDRTIRLTYDSYGNVATARDAEGNLSTLEYDAAGNPTKLTDPRGGVLLLRYDAASNLVGTTDPLLSTTTREYDKVGNLVRSVDEEGAESLFVYNARDQIVRIQDSLGHQWTRTYDAAGMLSSRIDPEGHRASYAYDIDRRIAATTDGNGLVTAFEYQFGKTEANPTAGLVVRTRFPTFTREIVADSLGRPVSEADIDSLGGRRTLSWRYDLAGNLTGVTTPDGRSTSATFDSLDRVRQVVQADAGVVVFDRDPWGQTLTIRDPKSHSTVLRFDKNDRLVSERRPSGGIRQFERDTRGQVTATVDAKGQRVEYSYDLSGRATSMTALTRSTTLTYNKRGDVMSYSDAQSSGAFSYDSLGRLLSQSIDFGTFAKGYQYTYYANGLVRTSTGPNGVSYELTYDGNGQPRTLSVPGEGSLSFSAYRWLRPTRITLPGGATREFDYDDLTRVTRIESKDPSGETFFSRQYTYDSADQVTRQVTEHGAYDYTYDDGYRLLTVDAPSLSDESYSYDPAANRSPSSGTAWSYGPNDELTSAGADQYEYDANGNRTRRTGPGSESRYFYDELDRLVRVETGTGDVVARYGYDAFDRRIWKEVGGARTYFYYVGDSLAAELDSSGSAIRSYVYEAGDALSPVLMKSPTGTDYFHDDRLGVPQMLTNAGGSKTWSALYAGYGTAQVVSSGAVNPHRFPGQYFDAETGLHQNGFRDYDPSIGRYLEADPAGTGPALNAMVRDTRPDGAFVAGDPAALLGRLNQYAYAGGNPIFAIDPLGLDWIEYTGHTITWYEGNTGNRSKMKLQCGGTSGMPGYQLPGLQSVPEDIPTGKGGPVPEGLYNIDLGPNPDREAGYNHKTCETYGGPGISKLPWGRPTDSGGTCTYGGWGNWRARLEPKRVPDTFGRHNFYLHDSSKGFTHGCVESCPDFLDQLKNYRAGGNKGIDVRIKYSDPTTNGGTTKTYP